MPSLSLRDIANTACDCKSDLVSLRPFQSFLQALGKKTLEFGFLAFCLVLLH